MATKLHSALELMLWGHAHCGDHVSYFEASGGQANFSQKPFLAPKLPIFS